MARVGNRKNAGHESSADEDAGGETENDRYSVANQSHSNDEGGASEQTSNEERIENAEVIGEKQAAKRSAFSRLASIRVSRVLDGLSGLKNLTNTASYDWTPEQLLRIFSTIDERLAETRSAFEAAKAPKVRTGKTSKQLSFEL
jgi:hypothetical protein